METHAQQRARERYNKQLEIQDLDNIKMAIKNNQHTFLYCSKDSNNKKFCYLTYNHIPYKILYSIRKKKCTIITIYPFDIDEYNKLEEQKKQQKINTAITLLQNNGYIVTKQD